jgi:sulfite exporter TauE/SafE
MTGTLLLTAALMGAAATPHCAAMCAGACRLLVQRADATRHTSRWWAWLIGRLLGYAAGGAAAASLGGSMRWLSQSQAWARPVWLMLQLAMLLLGLMLLWHGRMPRSIDQWLQAAAGRPAVAGQAPSAVHVVRWKSDLALAGTGALWVALPCGVLQAALVVAALASHPAEGAAAMGLFALASTPGLILGQILWLRLWPQRGQSHAASTHNVGAGTTTIRWPLRLAGAGIAVMSGSTVIMAAWTPLQTAWCA